ncbi:MAG: 3-isopropylmalate dehydratase [Pseudomonadota bacterium]
MDNILKGRVSWIFGDHFDVDLIVGIKNISATEMNALLAEFMQSYDKGFKDSVKEGDFLVGGSNFGYGHPHPQAMMVMRELGINAIISESFAFPFYRSEVASGMALITCPEVLKKVSRWDELELYLEKGILNNLSTGEKLVIDPVPPVALEIIDAGGIVNYLKALTLPIQETTRNSE